MIDFLKRMEENSSMYREKPLFADGAGQCLTFGEFYELTGRVYAYLACRGIGLEDFVLVCLPRGVQPAVASCGILRAGAAFVIVEDTLPAERIDYIRTDCGCKLTIDEVCWQEILQTEPLDGYVPRDDHSAALAVYTSGTTGAPKGVLHEYGNIDRMIAASPLPTGPEVARFALCSPLNFVLSAMAILVLVAAGTTLIYVVPFATLKDPRKLKAYLVENKITFAFLSPLFVKKMAPVLSSLVFCVVGAEPANDLFSADFAILNGYTMSEVGFTIAAFLIDKPYPNTPVGASACGYPVRLLDEEGHEVPRGDKGEIVVENPYVRGYINLPERTAAAFEDGWYHTGDLGFYDEEGRLVVSGRLDDMGKVNGNRVEPGEIEAIARRVLGLQWAAAKLFNEGGKSFVCLYYLENKQMDAQEARRKMAEHLPHYMLPAFFVHIDEIPLTAAGKFNRRALCAPEAGDSRAEYRAPETDAERALCAAFSKALSIAAVGADDDFSALGGDSIAAMEVVVASGLDGLSVADVLQGHTPAGIAALYEEQGGHHDVETANAQALEKNFPLTPNQAYTVEWQLREPASTMRNNDRLMTFDPNVVDMQRMASAMHAAVLNHPALATEIYYGAGGELRQRFSPDMLGGIEVEHLSEAEFAKVKDTLSQPFTMIETPLVRVRVFQTELAGYVFFDVHHTVFDGHSQGVLLSDVMAAYEGRELAKDYYPYILDMQGCLAGSDAYEANRAYFDQRYGNVDWCRHLAVIGEACDSEIHLTKAVLPVSASHYQEVEKSLGVSKNEFFALCAALAMSLASNASNVMLFWTFNGRTDVRELQTVGNLRSSLPLAFAFNDADTLEDLCRNASEQIAGGIAHCRYSYLEENPSYLDEGVARVLHQGGIGAAPQVPGCLGATPLGRHSNSVSRIFTNLEIAERGDDFVLTTKYTEDSFDAEEVDRFLQLFDAAIKVLAAPERDSNITCAALKQEILDLA